MIKPVISFMRLTNGGGQWKCVGSSAFTPNYLVGRMGHTPQEAYSAWSDAVNSASCP